VEEEEEEEEEEEALSGSNFIGQRMEGKGWVQILKSSCAR
jgi:hypothetical protein